MLAGPALTLGVLLAGILEFVSDYDALVGFVITWVGIGWVYWRNQRRWKRKLFIGQVNFSLNDVHDGRLTLRTLTEAPSADVFLNKAAANVVQAAALKTTADQPFLKVTDQADWGFIQRSCLNVISERFAGSYVARALGRDVPRAHFVFGITCENYGERMNARKIRVLLVERKLFERMFTPDADPAEADALTFSDETHRDRVTTLRAMGRLYRSKNEAERRLVGSVEIGIPV